MKNINYTRLGRKVIITLTVLIIVAGGYEIIFDLIKRFIVEYITGNIEYNIFVKLLFIPAALVILFYQIRLIYNRYKPSFNQVMVFILLMWLFIIARFDRVEWEWVTIVKESSVAGKWYSFVSGLILLDVVWLFWLYPLIMPVKMVLNGYCKSNQLRKNTEVEDKWYSFTFLVRFYEFVRTPINRFIEQIRFKICGEDSERNNVIKSSFFVHDKPVDDSNEKYQNITEQLTEKILEANYDSAFSIGIVGPYGNGKTSLLNHFSDQIGKEADIIEFYPSFSSRPEIIVDDYFSLLAHKLKKYDGRMNQIMVEYIAKLLELSINKSRNIQGLLKSDNRMFKGRPAHSLYQELKSIFEKLPKKVFVFIDDVDRLGRDEILEVFKIIRNTSDLPNIIFVVAFDKDYVVKTIDKDFTYINKYFQYELYLPPQTEDELIDYFVEEVLNRFGKGSYEVVRAINYNVIKETLFSRFVFNYRDAKALLNNYIMNIKFFSEEIDYIDLLHFTIMMKHYPKQVRTIYDRMFDIFEPIGDKGLEMFRINEKGIHGEDRKVDNIINELDVSDKNSKDMFKLLFLTLFKPVNADLRKYGRYKYENRYEVRDDLVINNIDRTHIYFELLMRDNDISKIQFINRLRRDGFIEYIDDLIFRTREIKKTEKREDIDIELKRSMVAFWKMNAIEYIIIENVVKYCYSYNKNIVDYLSGIFFKDKSLINFGGLNVVRDKTQYRSIIWNNKNYSSYFKIECIINIENYLSSVEVTNEDLKLVEEDRLYIGCSKDEIKSLLIDKMEEQISDMYFSEEDLNLISKVLDSGLLDDEDIGLSSFLLGDIAKLELYLTSVREKYREGMTFDSAIFKVFTDKVKLKNTEGNFLINSLPIREFYHLLELKELRDGCDVEGFVPFYFNRNSIVKYDSKCSIYFKTNKSLSVTGRGSIQKSNNDSTINLNIINLKESYYLIEGRHSYKVLMDELFDNDSEILGSFSSSREVIEINHGNELISIQTYEHIPDNIKEHITYYKELKQYEYVQ
jgi:hypothetical protein